MSGQHTNGSALRAWLEVATADLPVELAGRTVEEIRLHVYAAQDEAVARGMNPEDAYRQALEALGDPAEVNRMYRGRGLDDGFDHQPEIRDEESMRAGTGADTGEVLMKNPRLVWESSDVRVSDEDGSRWYDIARPEILIGRKNDNDVMVLHPNASRHHAKLVAVPDGYELVDLDSKFGTFVNGTRIQRHRLKAGDRIRIAEDAAELNYL